MNILSEITVNDSAYPTTAQVDVGAEPDFITVVNLSAVDTDVVYVSFDGVNDHGVLTPTILQQYTWNAKRKKVWLRLASGTTDVGLQVIAYTVV